LRDRELELLVGVDPFQDVIDIEYDVGSALIRIIVDQPKPIDMIVVPRHRIKIRCTPLIFIHLGGSEAGKDPSFALLYSDGLPRRASRASQ
jgi:hypothetical protein